MLSEDGLSSTQIVLAAGWPSSFEGIEIGMVSRIVARHF